MILSTLPPSLAALPDEVDSRGFGSGVVDGSHVDVAILGAGIAGIGLGLRLAGSGTSFLVLERADEVGGTWRDNRYPGVECDVPAHLYSYSFRPKADWSQVYAGGAEIQDYLRNCARSPGLAENVRVSTEVEEAVWDAPSGLWRIRTGRGGLTATVLVAAAGRLSEPRIPEIPGLDSFRGRVFHSSQWPEGLDLAGLRVGVVGTGASAIQMVPRISSTAAQTMVFQRSAPWVLPRGNRRYTASELVAFRDDAVRRSARDQQYRKAETGHAARLGEPAAVGELRSRALHHLATSIADPRLRDALTPHYEIGCKRILLSDDYFPALASRAVTLEASALTGMDGRRAVAASGAGYQLDLLVLATGFRAAEAPFAERIVGRGGIRLSSHWSRGMTAHASTAMHGFPNFFVLDGPNASLGHNSAVAMIETQIDYVLGALDALGPGDSLEATAEAEASSTTAVDEAARSTVWQQGGCTSWYRDERSGRLTLLWPGSAESFRHAFGRFDPSGYLRSSHAGSPAVR